MPKEEKTVFISYRRAASRYAARAIFQHLRQESYDVFMDVKSIASEDFARITLGEIAARAHFLVLLASGTVDLLEKPDDWLRIEIEHALKFKRNVIPILHSGYIFTEAEPHLTGKLRKLKKLNTLTVSNEYFEAAMDRLCSENLKIPVYGKLKSTAEEDCQEVEWNIETAAQEHAPSPEQLTAEDHFNKGYQKGVEGNFIGAIMEFSHTIQLDSQFSFAYAMRGAAYGKLGKPRKAISDLDKAIQLDPQDSVAYDNRGYVSYNLGEYRKAIQDYDKAIQLNPRDPVPYNNRGFVYYDLGEHRKAFQDHDKAIQLDSQNASAYSGRGTVYLLLGKHRKAIKDFDKAIKLDPRYATVYSNRGAAYGNLGKHRKAIEDYDKAIQLDPQEDSAYTGRGYAFYLLGEHRKAIKDFEKALKLNPDNIFAENKKELAEEALK